MEGYIKKQTKTCMTIDINLSTKKNSNNKNEREIAIYNKARTVMTKITEEEVLLTIWYDTRS